MWGRIANFGAGDGVSNSVTTASVDSGALPVDDQDGWGDDAFDDDLDDLDDELFMNGVNGGNSRRWKRRQVLLIIIIRPTRAAAWLGI